VGVSTHKNEPDCYSSSNRQCVYEVVLTSVNFKQDHYAAVKEAIAKAAESRHRHRCYENDGRRLSLIRNGSKPINCKAALKFVLQDENITTAIPRKYELRSSCDECKRQSRFNDDRAGRSRPFSLVNRKAAWYCQGCGALRSTLS